ncbi:bifunctional lytic transglycosylase/C40 family peptidase [Paenibacillus polymyxa]|nr:bifunctional lytic transglycosylase/C40 family peptidase [Paenibacillus polymyxa]
MDGGEMNAQDLANDAAGQAGGAGKKIAGKVARKAAGKAAKFLKKLAKDFIKKLLLALGKSLLAFIGPYGLAIIAVVILIAVILTAIPYSDWFLGGGSRTEAQKKADIEYEQKFKLAADKTVEEIYGIDAEASWKTQLINTIKPSWGIPSALVRYHIVAKNKKVEYSDYDPDELIEFFKPEYKYTTIKNDKEWTKTITACANTGTDIEYSTYIRENHDVLSKVSFDYGEMVIKPLKRYYPGGGTTRPSEWELVWRDKSDDCTVTRYRQYEKTMVDDRFVPSLNIDVPEFQQVLINQGIKKTDMKLVYEFIKTADPSWNSMLYGGYRGINAGTYFGQAQVTESVMRYESLVRKYAELNGVEDQVNLILALIQQESGGNSLDVMQSSESAGLPPNTLTDPEISIMYGVRHFAAVFRSAGGDIKLTLQAYNFGGGFIDYAKKRGGYSKENAVAFSEMMADRNGWRRYGDVDYVEHVLRYYSETGSLQVSSDGQIFDVQEVLNVMSNYMGRPYVWGGRRPEHGGFDCSGILEYSFNKIGINMYGTAQVQYNKTVPVNPSEALPGDLVFWVTKGSAPTHVGMYLGNDKFINSNNSHGLSISSINTWNRLYPFLGYRRIVK